ncbi:MAG: hypothetical protein CVU07_05595 [Bacteroidetes bacterium HGW-Bacteroidetes-23]|nr:MAG: hypothetical protein CVU07_05595 [Bacteroidetes bacterium HGW-Bacteroidetes-23]
MKKNIFLLLLSVFGTVLMYAQSNTVVSGSNVVGSNGSVTYSVGQIDYKTNNGTNATISQGVQQPFEINTLGTNDIPQIQLVAMVYPNPTFRNVVLTIKDYDFTNLDYQLFDSNGRALLSGKIKQDETQLEIENLSASHYFLHITRGGSTIKTFKIIKN